MRIICEARVIAYFELMACVLSGIGCAYKFPKVASLTGGKFSYGGRSNLPLSRLIVGGNNTRSSELAVALVRLNLRRQPSRERAADSISSVENFHGGITMSTTSFLREWHSTRRAKLLFIEMAVFQAQPAAPSAFENHVKRSTIQLQFTPPCVFILTPIFIIQRLRRASPQTRQIYYEIIIFIKLTFRSEYGVLEADILYFITHIFTQKL